MCYWHVRQKVRVEEVFVANVFRGDHYELHVGFEFWDEAQVQVVADHSGKVAAETSNEIQCVVPSEIWSFLEIFKIIFGQQTEIFKVAK